VPESQALDYVLGYAVGNDVSHRDWQIKRGGGQWGLGKGFDAWAPFGPGIVSTDLIRDPQALTITTKLNGKTVQVGTWSLLSPFPSVPGQTAEASAEKLHGGHDLQREEDHRLSEPRNDPVTRRRHFYWDVSTPMALRSRMPLTDMAH